EFYWAGLQSLSPVTIFSNKLTPTSTRPHLLTVPLLRTYGGHFLSNYHTMCGMFFQLFSISVFPILLFHIPNSHGGQQLSSIFFIYSFTYFRQGPHTLKAALELAVYPRVLGIERWL
ncbi:mCG145131, partial [Mus musculus]